MRRNLRLLVLAALAAATLAGATAALGAGSALALRPGSTLWLTGTSTLHDYEAKATQLDVTFAIDPARPPAAGGAAAIEGLVRANGVTGTDVVVAVTGLKSGKDGLDKNMYKALLAEQHPEIRFHLAGYQCGGEDSLGLRIESKGTLSIAGADREITIAAHGRRDGENLRLAAEVPLLMTDYGIKPPKMMMGTIKTGNQVVVHFDLVIGIAQNAAAPATASGSE